MLMKKLLLFALLILPFSGWAQNPNDVLQNPSFQDWPPAMSQDSFIYHLTAGLSWRYVIAPISLAQTPDNVIIRATSSNFLLNNGKGIPGSVLDLDEIAMVDQNNSTFGLAIDNGAFEYWPTIFY